MFRAFRLAPGGEIREMRSSPRGVLHMKEAQFAAVLHEEIGDWVEDGETQVLMCGMVGSRQGWTETAYLPCPANVASLVQETVPVRFPNADVRIIPGVSDLDEHGVPELLRGEETACMGVLNAGQGNALACFPGSHSKWVHLENGAISRFNTYVTGELFAAVRQGTIIGRTMISAAREDCEGFERGVQRSGQSGGLLHHLFGVRTLTLAHLLDEAASASYLSGLLIGHEVRQAMPPDATVHLVGSPALCSFYARAIEICGGRAHVHAGNAAARGLAAIGARLAWN